MATVNTVLIDLQARTAVFEREFKRAADTLNGFQQRQAAVQESMHSFFSMHLAIGGIRGAFAGVGMAAAAAKGNWEEFWKAGEKLPFHIGHVIGSFKMMIDILGDVKERAEAAKLELEAIGQTNKVLRGAYDQINKIQMGKEKYDEFQVLKHADEEHEALRQSNENIAHALEDREPNGFKANLMQDSPGAWWNSSLFSGTDKARAVKGQIIKWNRQWADDQKAAQRQYDRNGRAESVIDKERDVRLADLKAKADYEEWNPIFDKAEKAADAMWEAGQRLKEQTRTPAEKYNEQVQHIEALSRAGDIDKTTYSRGMKAAYDQFHPEEKVGQAMWVGSQMSIAGLMGPGKDKTEDAIRKACEETAKNTARMATTTTSSGLTLGE
jgi:hypothetical protein